MKTLKLICPLEMYHCGPLLKCCVKKYNLWYRQTNDSIQIMHAYDLDKEIPVEFGIRTRVFNLKYASAPQVADAISSVMGDRVEYVLPTQLKSYEHLKLSDLDEDTGTIENTGLGYGIHQRDRYS